MNTTTTAANPASKTPEEILAEIQASYTPQERQWLAELSGSHAESHDESSWDGLQD